MKKVRRGVVVGYPYWTKYLAELINARSRSWRLERFPDTRVGTLRALLALRDADALICIGGPGPIATFTELARRRNQPVVVFWMGTDVMIAQQAPQHYTSMQPGSNVNFAITENLANELRHVGIDASYLTLISADVPEALAPLPQRFGVLTYLPEPRRLFYGAQHVYALAASLPDVRFTVVGAGGPDPAAPPNVVFAGFVRNMPQLIDECTVLLRLPEHDGPAAMVLEALAHGRHVIWTYDFPNVHKVGSCEEALEVLCTLHERHAQGTLESNQAGRDYVREHLTPALVAPGVEEALDRVVATQREQPTTSRAVVISGSSASKVYVALLAQQLRPDWSTRVLHTDSRLGMLAALVDLFSADVWYSIGAPRDNALGIAARMLRTPRVIHWAADDLEVLRRNARLRATVAASASHLAENALVARQLAEFGIEAVTAPLPQQPNAGQPGNDGDSQVCLSRIVTAWEVACASPRYARSIGAS